MRSAKRLAQHAQWGSGQTSQTTSASQPAKRPMLKAMSAEITGTAPRNASRLPEGG